MVRPVLQTYLSLVEEEPVEFLGSFQLGLFWKACSTLAFLFFSFPCLRASPWFLISKRICSLHIWDTGPLIPALVGRREE